MADSPSLLPAIPPYTLWAATGLHAMLAGNVQDPGQLAPGDSGLLGSFTEETPPPLVGAYVLSQFKGNESRSGTT